MNEIRFYCHACGRVNVIDESLLDNMPLHATCNWCGQYHDETAIRLTPVRRKSRKENLMPIFINQNTSFPDETLCPECGWPMYCCLCEEEETENRPTPVAGNEDIVPADVLVGEGTLPEPPAKQTVSRLVRERKLS